MIHNVLPSASGNGFFGGRETYYVYRINMPMSFYLDNDEVCVEQTRELVGRFTAAKIIASAKIDESHVFYTRDGIPIEEVIKFNPEDQP